MYWLFSRKGFLEHKSNARPVHNKNSEKNRNRGEFHQFDKENLQKPTANIIFNSQRQG